MSDTIEFATRLNSLRAKAGLSEVEMCAWLGGVPKSTLGSWSRGDRKPHWFIASGLEKAMKFLEQELKLKASRFPVPLRVRQNDRLAYVRTVRADYPPL